MTEIMLDFVRNNIILIRKSHYHMMRSFEKYAHRSFYAISDITLRNGIFPLKRRIRAYDNFHIWNRCLVITLKAPFITGLLHPYMEATKRSHRERTIQKMRWCDQNKAPFCVIKSHFQYIMRDRVNLGGGVN